MVAGAEKVAVESSAGDRVVSVTVSETYDLHTRVNKMTLIGVHTPGKTLIQKSYPGLCMNSKYVKIKKIDVTLAAISTLPISPDQVGTDSDKIAPQDMMNPILYKAVSNDAMSNIEARLMALRGSSSLSLAGSMIDADAENVTTIADESAVYYSLLSNRDGFRIAHPQQGLSMKGLVPLVFEKYYNTGAMVGTDCEVYYDGDQAEDITPDADKYNVIQPNANRTALVVSQRNVQAMRGRPHPMPRFPTTYVTSVAATGNTDNVIVDNGMGDGLPKNSQCQMPEILPVYCGLIIMPPAKRTVMYYRMVVRCTLEFSEVRPMSEIASLAGLDAHYGALVYHTDYSLQSKEMDNKTDLVDVQNADIEKIMEGR